MASLQKVQSIVFEVQEACRQMGLGVPTGVFDSNDEHAQLMGSLANLAGILLCDQFNWQHLQEKFTISPNGVLSSWALPDDFSSFVDNTGWSHASSRRVFVLNPQRWAAAEAWLGNSMLSPVCRIYQNTVQFLTPPRSGDTITFQYKVKNWVIDGTNQNAKKDILSINADIPDFDWLMMVLAIKVKFLEQKGMSTISAQSDLNDRYFQLTNKDQMAPILQIGGPPQGEFRYLDGVANVPDTNFGI